MPMLNDDLFSGKSGKPLQEDARHCGAVFLY